MAQNKVLEQLEEKLCRHGLSTCEKLASIRNEPSINNEMTEYIAPAIVAEYMNELQEGYKIVDRHLIACTEKQREFDRLNYRIKDMTERATEVIQKQTELSGAIAELDSMKFYQGKKDIDSKINRLINSERNAREFFERTFKVKVEAVQDKIQQTREQIESITREIQYANVERFREIRNMFVVEYQKQKLLTEIRPDGKEILKRIKTPSAQLDHISDVNFKRITRELSSAQIRILMENRKKSKVRTYERVR